MKKKEFVGKLKDLGIIDANGTYDAFSKVITEALIDGDEVALVGIGTFKLKDRAERQMKAPNGKEITVKAHKALTFKASSVIKEAVNN